MAVWEEQGLMGEVSLLERLDAFFGEGANTEAVGNFFSEEYELVQRLDYSNDSAEALELYALFRRYNALVSKILDAFSSREAAAGKPVTLEELAAAVMEDYRQPQDFCRYLGTGYIAGSLDFDPLTAPGRRSVHDDVPSW
uniref:BART domain-containing protein n=1 Tax=Trypanosoma congolense (strain IL3000) TaxID=1068625 RepID=G0UUC0_TRYCI|nr:hypothetical protein, unlikely [Trypanosoma congolense IL3000]